MKLFQCKNCFQYLLEHQINNHVCINWKGTRKMTIKYSSNVKLARVELALERLRIAVEELKEELEK